MEWLIHRLCIFCVEDVISSLFFSINHILKNLLQAKIKGMESQLNEALRAGDARSTVGSESGSSGVLSTPRQVNDSASSSAVTRKLEEELSKRDALIEVCYGGLDFPFPKYIELMFKICLSMNFNTFVTLQSMVQILVYITCISF